MASWVKRVKADGFLVFGGRSSSTPTGSIVLLEDVALAIPKLYGGGGREVVDHSYSEVDGRRAGEHRAEEDVFEVGTSVLFCIFKETHGENNF